jgi:hypothetical protein
MRDIMNNLHQVLIVNPQFSFGELSAVMKSMGWQNDSIDSGIAPLIDGEPHVACWSFYGNKPYVTYTFNAVVKMRVLDVAGVPPRMRELLATHVPLIDQSMLAFLFDDEDSRKRLLALWIVQETEQVEFMESVKKLMNDPEVVIAQQAKEVLERLEKINQARTEVLVQMRIMEEAVPALIHRLADPQFVKSLMPSEEDLRNLFDEELVEPAMRAVKQIYLVEEPSLPISNFASIQPKACPAGLLRWPNFLSNQFPGSYRDLAGWMTPNRIWVCWKTVTDDVTVSYDGLVWIDDHWCWLPKLFRALGSYLLHNSANNTRH